MNLDVITFHQFKNLYCNHEQIKITEEGCVDVQEW